MEPITLIVTALSAGAAAATKSTVKSVVKDSYEGIKAFIKRKFQGKVSVEDLERNPNSENKRGSLKEDLESVKAEDDTELFQLAKQLIEAIKEHAPETDVSGVNLEDVEAEFLKIQEVHSTGSGIIVKKSKFEKGIDIGIVKSGNVSNPT